MGGKAATGGDNQLTTTTSNAINGKIVSHILEKASINLFNEIDNKGSADNILSDEIIKNYATTILEALKAETDVLEHPTVTK